MSSTACRAFRWILDSCVSLPILCRCHSLPLFLVPWPSSCYLKPLSETRRKGSSVRLVHARKGLPGGLGNSVSSKLYSDHTDQTLCIMRLVLATIEVGLGCSPSHPELLPLFLSRASGLLSLPLALCLTLLGVAMGAFELLCVRATEHSCCLGASCTSSLLCCSPDASMLMVLLSPM